MTRLGFIGAGALGTAMGERLERAGHEVGYADSSGGHADVAARADVVVLAVPFAAIDTALSQLSDLGGKVLWSCVNALKADLSGLALGFDGSAAEEVARRAPGARVVSALPPFAAALRSPTLSYDAELTPTVFVCGDDGGAKETVAGLIRDLGADPQDVGGLGAARLVEPAMMLLIKLAYGASQPRDLALRLLERCPR